MLRVLKMHACKGHLYFCSSEKLGVAFQVINFSVWNIRLVSVLETTLSAIITREWENYMLKTTGFRIG
jgi:hypothetical protein